MSELDEKRIQERAYQIKCRDKALAFLRRCREANIPDQYWRINEKTFSSLLFPEYYGSKEKAKEFSKAIYHDPSNLFKIPFILIDGGDVMSRNKAGFALLFRLITCDKFGIYKGCKDLVHKFQSIKSTEAVLRNDAVDDLKGYDILFINEFDRGLFKPHFETGDFFDELLEHRCNREKPTIISFTNPVGSIENNKNDKSCGIYMADLCVQEKPSEEVLRIRVRKR